MTTSTKQFDSNSILNLDSVPTYSPTRGAGAPEGSGGFYKVADYISVVAATMLPATTTGQVFRLVRIPVEAMIQKVLIFSDNPLDTNTSPTLALDFNLAFSDANTTAVGQAAGQGSVGSSVQDGTPATFAGQVPTSANTGAVTPQATYSSPNILFGTYTVQSHTVGIPWGTDITFPGATGLAANAYTVPFMQAPMWYNFGFVNNNLPVTTSGGLTGTPGPNIGGFFDLVAVVSVTAATGAAAKLWAEVTYCLA